MEQCGRRGKGLQFWVCSGFLTSAWWLGQITYYTAETHRAGLLYSNPPRHLVFVMWLMVMWLCCSRILSLKEGCILWPWNIYVVTANKENKSAIKICWKIGGKINQLKKTQRCTQVWRGETGGEGIRKYSWKDDVLAQIWNEVVPGKM